MTSLPALLATALLMAPVAASAGDLLEVRAAGGRSCVWLVLTTQRAGAAEAPTSRLIYRAATAGQFQRYLGGQTITGQVRQAAALGDSLHVFFAGGAHMEYSPQGQAVRAVLPGRTPPVLVCPDEAAGALWALAKLDTSGTRDEVTTAVSSTYDGALSLLRYEQARWTVFGQVASRVASAAQRWMCAVDGVVHMFWLEPSTAGELWHAVWQDQRWDDPVRSGIRTDGAFGLAMVLNRQVALLVSSSPEGDSGGKVRLARLTGGRWVVGPVISTDPETPALDPAELLAAPLGQKLAIGTWQRAGRLQMGLLEPGSAYLELTAVAVAAPAAPSRSGSPPWTVAVLTAAIMFVLLWRRQSSLLSAAELPSDLACAAIWRRAVAFGIDSLPAVAVAAPLWLMLIGQLAAGGSAVELDPSTQAKLAGRAWLTWAVFRCVQASYCIITEIALGASPGKRLLGCRVVTEQGGRPAVRQVILRNILRILELEMDPPLLPLLLLAVLTRNRQRLGDIVARTLVVEHRPVGQARPVKRGPEDGVR
jgi:uncharacterized RDD family membrane protein YckC